MKNLKILLILLLTLLIMPLVTTGCGGEKAATNKPADFQTYTDPNNLFSISYPDSWQTMRLVDYDEAVDKLSSNTELDNSLSIFMIGAPYYTGYHPSVMIMAIPCPPFTNTIDGLANMITMGMEMTDDNYNEISREIKTIDCREAFILDSEGNFGDDTDMHLLQMYILSGKNIWVLMCSVMPDIADYDDYEEAFHNILESFRILIDSDEPSPTPTATINPGTTPTPATVEEQIEQIFTATAEIRGLEPLDEVTYGSISTDELQTRYTQLFEEEYSYEAAGIDQEIYVLMDLMESEQDLREILLNVMSEQVAGYYDDESKELYIVSDDAELNGMDKVYLSHEYTHSLQDQYFNLSSLTGGVENNSDRLLAVTSLVEGDATLTMYQYAFNELSVSEIEDIINEAAGIDLDELDNAPAIISENLMFPYEAGLDFIMEFEDWDAINEAFSDPPQSTEQIIHPEKYLSVTYFDKPQTIAMPDIDSALGGTWEMKYSDVLGEFNTRIYLEAFLTNTSAGDAAAGWDGDKLEYWKNNAGEQLLVMYWIWDTRNDAEEFFDAYLDFMEEKTGGDWNLALDDTWDRWWQTDDRSVYLSKQGSNTLVVITTDIDIVEDLVAEFD